MKCVSCDGRIVFSNPDFCKTHFIDYFEKKVTETIKKFKLITEDDLRKGICAGVSGGKDSLTVLYILSKYFGNATALAIDEGISGYRERTLEWLKKFCNKNKINYKIIQFRDEFGTTLDELLKRKKINPCTACGIFRRYLLNKHSKNYSAIATGHNLDDECQSIIMNFLSYNPFMLSKLGPISGMSRNSKFTKRIKPLYFCTEKEVLAYSILQGFEADYNECPYSTHSFRADVRDFLNETESRFPGTKKKIINNALNIIEQIGKKSGNANICRRCSEPSSKEICNACLLAEKLKGM